MKTVLLMTMLTITKSHYNLFRGSLIGFCLLVSIGCDKHPTPVVTGAGEVQKRVYDRDVVVLGRSVYEKHCAHCHGENAEGDLQWRKPDAQGKYPPPPLDGSGHSWHHSRVVLRGIIENGSQDGMGNMPAWRDELSKQEIEAVITWFQSLWPDQVYAAWFEMQKNIQR